MQTLEQAAKTHPQAYKLHYLALLEKVVLYDFFANKNAGYYFVQKKNQEFVVKFVAASTTEDKSPVVAKYPTPKGALTAMLKLQKAHDDKLVDDASVPVPKPIYSAGGAHNLALLNNQTIIKGNTFTAGPVGKDWFKENTVSGDTGDKEAPWISSWDDLVFEEFTPPTKPEPAKYNTIPSKPVVFDFSIAKTKPTVTPLTGDWISDLATGGEAECDYCKTVRPLRIKQRLQIKLCKECWHK